MTTTERQIWESWARFLHRLGLEDFTAAFMEATRPVLLVGAQLVYIGQPVLNVFTSDIHIDALADLLSKPDKQKDFTALLREKHTE